MTIPTQKNIGAAFGRGIMAATLLAVALSVNAQQGDLNKPKTESKSPDSAARSGDVTTCITEAAKMNNATIKFAQLASEKGQNAELKRFVRTLEQDHKKAQDKLEKIAQKHNVTLPTSLDARCQEELSKLQSLSGAEFDKEFVKGALEGHAVAMTHLEKASKEVKDADVAQYTRDMLAQVRNHQRQTREIAKSVGLDQATIDSLEAKAKENVGSPGAASETSRGADSSKSLDNPNKAAQPDPKN
jgi:putative membrane protein